MTTEITAHAQHLSRRSLMAAGAAIPVAIATPAVALAVGADPLVAAEPEFNAMFDRHLHLSALMEVKRDETRRRLDAWKDKHPGYSQQELDKAWGAIREDLDPGSAKYNAWNEGWNSFITYTETLLDMQAKSLDGVFARARILSRIVTSDDDDAQAHYWPPELAKHFACLTADIERLAGAS